MDQDQDLYAILGITKDELDADPSILKKAFRRAAQQAHSDQNGGDDERMKAINLANSILGDPEKRRIYDETGSSQVANGYRADIEKAFAMMFLEHLNRSMAEVANLSLSDLVNRVQNRASDPMVSLRAALESNLDALQESVVQIGKQIRKLERAATRLKFKGKATEKNVLALAIKGAIAEAEQRKTSSQRQISFLSDIRVECDKYECSLVDAPVSPGNVITGKRAPQLSFARAMKESSAPDPEAPDEPWVSVG